MNNINIKKYILTFYGSFTIIIFTFEKRAPLAQLVEQWTVNPCVAGSKPAGGGKGLSKKKGQP